MFMYIAIKEISAKSAQCCVCTEKRQYLLHHASFKYKHKHTYIYAIR